MTYSELLERAKAAAIEAEKGGFPHTAAAMRDVVKTMMSLSEKQKGIESDEPEKVGHTLEF